jgi:molecular chaperone DnaK
MVKEAEAHAEEDHKRREAIDAKNQLDGLVYQTEKTLKEFQGDLDDASKSNLESALDRAKKAVEKGEVDELRAATETLTQASHKLAEVMYKRTVNKDGQQPPHDDGAAASSESGSAGSKGDDVVDADFEEVK